MLASLESFALRIPFKIAFKHASAERNATQAVWVEARSADGIVGYGEGCPREYVTSETVGSAREFISSHRDEWVQSLNGIQAVREWIESHARDVDANPSAWTAVELAMLDLFGKSRRCTVESLLELPELEGRYQYTAVLGDASPEAFRAQLMHYVKAGFRRFKIKLAGQAERDTAKVGALKDAGIPPEWVRADANNLWTDSESASESLQALGFPFFALEEPLKTGDLEGMRRIATRLRTRIILDESALRAGQLPHLGQDAQHWIVNIRVSKMGGLVRSLEVLREARRLGLDVIVGAHVGETSVLTRAALVVAASAGQLLVAQEGAFGTHLLERDVVDPPIMFGPGGTLDAEALDVSGVPGFGLTVSSALALQRDPGDAA
jgi:L-alanine-DL-glutamate epimerase-like enolase superfamily enzyme